MNQIDDYSTFLQTVSGTIKCEFIDYRQKSFSDQIILLCMADFVYKKGKLDFKNIKQYFPDVFEYLRDQIDNMLMSYIRGFMISTFDHSYVHSSIDIPLDKWLERKRKFYEASAKGRRAKMEYYRMV